MIGQTLGHYCIIEKIGEGGMGVVYRASDERLDRDVALKVLPAGTFVDETARKRFRNEALALSHLNHPNIATVHDFDTQDEIDFLVMEYVAGGSLSKQLAGKNFSEKDVAALGVQMAEALEDAHEHGIVHRDLKPGNIALTPKGRIKILDFGLATLLHPGGDEDVTQSFAETPDAAGTLPYMSPEQLKGEAADGRSDIFSLGAVLYEMATGRRASDEKISSRLIDAILHQAPVPPRALNTRTSPELERIILKCLEKEPENRYQSAKEIAVDLRRLGAASATTAANTQVMLAVDTSRRRARSVWIGAAALLGVTIMLAAFGFGGWRKRLSSGVRPEGIKSLAVLPLENLSHNADEDYFADGMTEELIADLGKISALRVTSRTSVMQYKQTRKTIPQIAKELGVDAVIEGSVLESGGRVRITAQLIDARTDRHIWAQSYQRDMQAVLSLQDEVARAIAGEIRAETTSQEHALMSAPRQVDPEVYQLYLKGRFHLNTQTEKEILMARQYFQQALAKDPQSALAYSGLASSYALLSTWYLPPREAMPPAKAAAQKAVELDESLAQAHYALGWVHFWFDWDFPGTEKEAKRAIELSPNYAGAHDLYGTYFGALGRYSESRAEFRRAQELDPLSLAVWTDGASVSFSSGQQDEAIEQSRRAITLDPRFGMAHAWLALSLALKGEFAEAISEAQMAHRLDDSPFYLVALADVYALAGRRTEAEKTLKELALVTRTRYVCSYEIATTYTALGEKEQAFHWLEKAYQDRSDCMPFLKVDGRLDPLHSDPRFADLLRRVGFPP